MTTKPSSLACDLTAIPPEERDDHLSEGQELFYAALESQELVDGFAFRFSPESDVILAVAEFISRERLCCPFLSFTIDLKPQGGSLWLRITGPAEAKAVLKAGFESVL